MPPLTALLIAWVMTALWPLIGKSGTEHFSPALFVQAGTAIGFLLLSPWLALRDRWRRILSAELRESFLVMGFLGSGLASVLYVTALQYTTPSNAAIMAQIEVLYSALLCAWWLGERVSLSQCLGSGLVVLGTGLIMAHDLSTPRWKGDLIILLTPWMFQVSHIYAKRLPENLDPVTIAGGRVFYGSLCLVPFTLWSLAHQPRWDTGAAGLGIVLAQAVSTNSANLVLWYLAIRGMDLAKATAILLSYPALTLLFSWGMGRETIRIVQVAGLLLTMAGATWVSLLVVKSHREARAVAEF